MDNYLIHACPQRMWYVQDYLVPSLQAQGINPIVRCDTEGLGCLESCMQIFKDLNGDVTWHLQDDVIICRDFAKRTQELTGIVNGFCWTKAKTWDYGDVHQSKTWYSFPCIRIPDDLARECAEWYYAEGKKMHSQLSRTGRFDDAFFYIFLNTKHRNIWVRNLKPNLVDHIDYLIGGTTVSTDRQESHSRAAWFEDKDLVDELERRLKSDKYRSDKSIADDTNEHTRHAHCGTVGSI